MTVDFKTLLESLLPPGAAWAVKSGGSFDSLLEGMANAYGDLRDSLFQLANIRNPDSTPILSDLEHEYGIIPDPSLTEAQRREVLKGVVYAKPGMGYDHLTVELHKAGFTNLFAYENSPLINPEFYTDGTWSAWCGGEDSFCGGEDAYCGYESGGSGYLLVNDQDSDASEDVPEDDDTWHLVFFVGGVKSDATVGWFLLVDGDMEAVGTTAWTAGPSTDACTLTKDAALVYEGTQSLAVSLTDHAVATDPETFYAPQDLGVDALDQDVKSAPLMHDAGSQVLYDSGFGLSDKARLNGENGDSGDVLGLGVASGGTNAADKLAIDFLDAQYARFEGEISDEGTFSCWAKVNDLSRDPTFDMNPGAATGYGDLPEDLTINGTTVSPTFRYEAQDADLTDWNATVGDDLTLAGSGTDPEFDTLAPGKDDYRVLFDAGKYYAGAAIAATTGDIVFEAIVKTGALTSGGTYILASTSSASAGFLLYHNASSTALTLYIRDSTPTIAQVNTPALEDDKYYHLIWFIDKSGSGVCYANVDPGVVASVSSVGSISSANALTVGATVGGTSPAEMSVSYLAMWTQATWLDTHLQEDIAKERAMIAMGLRPDVAAAGVEVLPTFKIPTSTSGYAALDEDITINGTTKSPTFRYEADQATTSAWLATVGDDLSIAGSGADPVIDEYAPGLTDSRVDLVAGKYYNKAASSFGDIGTDDFVIELVGKIEDESTALWTKSNSGSDRCMLFGNATANALYLYLDATVVAANNISNEAGWWHLICFVDRSGSATWYSNGIQQPATVVSSLAARTLGSGSAFEIGALAGGNKGNHSIAYLSMWQGAGWLDTHLQADVAAERAAKAFGIYPSIAAGDPLPTVATRATTAYVEKLDSSDNSLLVPVSSGWMRVNEEIDESAEKLTGYLSETQATNLIPYSEGGGSWALVDAGDTLALAAATAPNGETAALSLAADSTDGNHGYKRASITLTAATHTFSCWADPGDVDHVKLECSTVTNAYAYFNANTGAVGTIGAGCSRAKMYGPFADGGYRCEMSFTGTAAAHDVQVLSANTDNDDTFAGDGSTVNTYLWGFQLEALEKASSYVPTAGATATRVKEDLRFTAGDNIGGEDIGKGAMECKALIHDGFESLSNIAVLNDGGSANDRITAYYGSSTARVYIAAAAVAQVSEIGVVDFGDGNIHTFKLNYGLNSVSMLIDGVLDGSDSSCVMPDDIDRIDVGQAQNVSGQFSGLLSDFTIYPSNEESYDGYLPKAFSRATESLIEKVLPGDTETALIPVGANWMRVDRVFDKDLSPVQGYNSRPQSTNLFTYSEEIGNAAWNKTNIHSTVTAGLTALGEMQFNGIVADTTDAIHSIDQATSPPATGYHVMSAYVSAGDKSFVYMDVTEVANGTCFFNLTTGAVSAGAGIDVAYAENKGGGEWRIWMLFNISGSTATGLLAPADSISDNTFAGDDSTVNLYVYGLQIEKQEMPTTYMMTGAATATRVADILTMYGIENLGSEDPTIVNVRTEHYGTFYDGLGYGGQVVNISDGTADDRITISSEIEAIVGTVVAGGASQVLINGFLSSYDGNKQVYEFECQLNKYKLFKARTQLESTDTSGTMPTGLTEIDIGQRYDSTLQFNGLIPRITISPYGLSRPRGIIGSVKTSTGQGQCIAYDDLFDGGFELRAIGDLDGEIQANCSPIAGSMSENTWYHVALTWDYAASNITLLIYIDGVELGYYSDAGTDPTISGDAPMILAAAAIDSLAAGGAVTIAAPKSFSEKLHEDQIQEEYARGVPEEKHTGLVSEYSSRPEDGDIVNDLINGYKLTVPGSPAPTLIRGWTEGGAALRFGAGVTGVASAYRKDHPFILSDDHTFEAWVKIEGGSDQVIWTNEGAAGYEQNLIYDVSEGEIAYTCVLGATERTISAAIDTSRLTHVVVTRVYTGGNTTLTLYLDGQSVTSATYAGAPAISASYGYIYFGAESSADYFYGLIQGIRLYDEALDSTEILALHDAGQTIIETGAYATQTIVATEDTTPITGHAYCEVTGGGDGLSDNFDLAYPVVLYKRNGLDNFRALFVGSDDSYWAPAWQTIDELVDSCTEIRFMCKNVTHTRPNLYAGEPGVVHFDLLAGGEESPESIIAAVEIPEEKRQILERIVMRCKPLHTWAGMVVRYV